MIPNGEEQIANLRKRQEARGKPYIVPTPVEKKIIPKKVQIIKLPKEKPSDLPTLVKTWLDEEIK